MNMDVSEHGEGLCLSASITKTMESDAIYFLILRFPYAIKPAQQVPIDKKLLKDADKFGLDFSIEFGSHDELTVDARNSFLHVRLPRDLSVWNQFKVVGGLYSKGFVRWRLDSSKIKYMIRQVSAVLQEVLTKDTTSVVMKYFF